MISEISSAADRTFSHFGWVFALLPLKQLTKSKFWKNEKKWLGDIILHMCAINDNRTVYGS